VAPRNGPTVKLFETKKKNGSNFLGSKGAESGVKRGKDVEERRVQKMGNRSDETCGKPLQVNISCRRERDSPGGKRDLNVQDHEICHFPGSAQFSTEGGIPGKKQSTEGGKLHLPSPLQVI